MLEENLNLGSKSLKKDSGDNAEFNLRFEVHYLLALAKCGNLDEDEDEDEDKAKDKDQKKYLELLYNKLSLVSFNESEIHIYLKKFILEKNADSVIKNIKSSNDKKAIRDIFKNF